jgi:hypothetical protein
VGIKVKNASQCSYEEKFVSTNVVLMKNISTGFLPSIQIPFSSPKRRFIFAQQYER